MKKSPFFFFLVLLGTVGFSWADTPVDVLIERAQDRFNLGLSEFSSQNTEETWIRAVRSTIKNDLAFSQLFNMVDQGPLVRKKTDAVEWAKFGSNIVVGGVVRSRSENRLEISATLYDTHSGKEVLTIEKKGLRGDINLLAHDVSNDIVKYFTGKPSIFRSKIAFVNDATGRKELYVADYSGENIHRLTNDNSIIVLPRISPDGKKIVFTSYVGGNPDLYIINMDGTGRRRLSSKVGLNVSPSWDTNSQDLALTLSLDGPPNIYLVNLQGQVLRRLTDAKTADTAPAFSPDGSQLAFTSDRGGGPQIYLMNIDGTGLRRLTTANYCDSSAWSPDGQTLVYVKGASGRGKFDIYSIEALTGVERRLTWGQGDSENPSWSPDGRFVLFVSNRRGKYELFLMSSDGSNQRPIPLSKGQCFTPHWGGAQ